MQNHLRGETGPCLLKRNYEVRYNDEELEHEMSAPKGIVVLGDQKNAETLPATIPADAAVTPCATPTEEHLLKDGKTTSDQKLFSICP